MLMKHLLRAKLVGSSLLLMGLVANAQERNVSWLSKRNITRQPVARTGGEATYSSACATISTMFRP